MNFLKTLLLTCCACVVHAADSPIKQMICSKNEQIKNSVLQCLQLVPSSFSESVESCNPGVKVNENYSQYLTFFCNLNEAEKKQSENCVKKKMREKGESLLKIAMPLLKCFQNIKT
ncbi:uncharacterized protein [Parasteatoda tepidariorum]|uniref:uncharacterized protein n=1 Tax=Parasteatoda tepidariorum TaxID=114398 RepID=UPI001C722C29|nr:uncharacterized protein LOC122269397 [Parasteatoda tepidariorum]